MWRRVVWYKGTNVSEESATSSVSQTLEGIWNPEDEGSMPLPKRRYQTTYSQPQEYQILAKLVSVMGIAVFPPLRYLSLASSDFV